MLFRSCFSREEETKPSKQSGLFVVDEEAETDDGSVDLSGVYIHLTAPSSPDLSETSIDKGAEERQPPPMVLKDCAPARVIKFDSIDSEFSFSGDFSDSDSSRQSRVSFVEEVSVRYISDDGCMDRQATPVPRAPDASRPPLPTKKIAPIRKGLLRRRKVVPCSGAGNVRQLFGIDPKEQHGAQSTPAQHNPTSPYLDGMSGNLEELMHVLVRRRIKYGEKNPWTGHVLLYIGGYHFRNGAFQLSEAAFLQAAECDQGEHPGMEGGYIVAEAFANLGAIYWNTGETDRAVKSLETALSWHETNEAAHGRDPDASLNIATCLDKLSMACTLDGSFDKAKRALTHCAHIHYRVGSDRLEFARILERLGMVNLYANDVDAAMSCYMQALHEKQQVGGKKHASLVSTYKCICMIHKGKGSYKDAEKALLRALRIQDMEWNEHRIRGNGARAAQECCEMAETLESLGELFKEQNKIDKCLRAIRDAVKCYYEAGLEADDARVAKLVEVERAVRAPEIC